MLVCSLGVFDGFERGKGSHGGLPFLDFTLAWGGSGLRVGFLGGVEKVGDNFVVSIVIAIVR